MRYFTIQRLRTRINPAQVSSIVPNGEGWDIVMSSGSRYNVTQFEYDEFNNFVEEQHKPHFGEDRQKEMIQMLAEALKKE